MSDRSLPKIDWRVVFNRAAPPGLRHWGRVRAAQLRELGPALVIAGCGLFFNALIVVIVLADAVPAVHLVSWLLSLAAGGLVVLQKRKRARGREIHAVGRRTIDSVTLYSIMFGLLWILPVRYFFSEAGPADQLVLGIMAAVMMAGAAFVFAPIPVASVAFILLMGFTITRMLMETADSLIWLIAPVYMVAMLGFVYINGRAFMLRTWLDFELEQRRETVSLLLRE